MGSPLQMTLRVLSELLREAERAPATRYREGYLDALREAQDEIRVQAWEEFGIEAEDAV